MKAEFENQEAQEKFTWLSSVLILPYEQWLEEDRARST